MKSKFHSHFLLFFGLLLLFPACAHRRQVFIPGIGTLHVRKSASNAEIDAMIQRDYGTKLDWFAQ